MNTRGFLRLVPSLRRAIDVGARRFAAAEAASSAIQMPFTLAAPGSAYYLESGNVRQVDVPTQTGVVGVMPHHVPLLAALKPGVVSVHEAEGAQKFFVSSGQLTVNKDGSVQILAEEMCKLEDIDSGTAKSELAAAVTEAGAASDDKTRAEAQIKIEVLEALVRAADQGV